MAITTTPPVPAPVVQDRSRRAAIGLAARQVRRGAVVVALVAAGMSATVAATYDGVIADAPGGAQSLSALAANPAVRTLFGEPVALDQVGGFTVWRLGTVLAVLIGTWAALTGVRVLRGEEDDGRWDLLLSGRVTIPAAVGRHLAVLVVAVTATGAAIALALLATGTAVAGAFVHAGSLALIGAFFAGVGGLAAQLWSNRGAAAGAAIGVLVVGLLARMVGDGVDALGWVRWLSPFGLAALARPYAEDRVLPLVVLGAAATAALVATTVAAGHRDLRAGVLPDPSTRRSSTVLLGSLPAFAVRSTLRPLTAWGLGIAAFHLLIGLIAASMTSFLHDNPLFADLARQAGFELDAVQSYAATLFTLLAIPLGAFAATRIGALARAERGRRLDLLLGTPTTRTRLLAAEVAAATAGVLALCTTAALAMWIGTTASGAPLDLPDALAGAANTLPVVALGLAAAVLALGWAPGAVVAVGLLPTAGGFLLSVLAHSTSAPAWVAALSPFDHLALVPTVPPDIPAGLIMTAIAAAVGAVGVIGYRRRDIRGD